MSWIRARFTGICVGERVCTAGEEGDARRFRFELHSGRVFDLESVGEPDCEESHAACDPKGASEYRQKRLKKVRFPPSEDPQALQERTLFDVRISDWQLKHPAEAKGRSALIVPLAKPRN